MRSLIFPPVSGTDKKSNFSSLATSETLNQLGETKDLQYISPVSVLYINMHQYQYTISSSRKSRIEHPGIFTIENPRGKMQFRGRQPTISFSSLSRESTVL